MNKLKLFFSKFRNKYLLVSTVFLLWLLFFDNNDLISQFKRSSQLSDNKETINYYQEEIQKIKQESDELFNSDQSKEKFAREKYFMKKDNEVIYIIKED